MRARYIANMVYIELSIVLILILFNGFLAMAELAVVSSRKARLQGLVDRGVAGARRALALASDSGKFLSTVQIGITLVGVLSGAFSGATLGLRLAEWLGSLGIPIGIAEIAGVGSIVAIITYASLIIGELVPKQIALRNPEKIASKVAYPMMVLAKVAYPLVVILDFSGRMVLRALGHRTENEARVSDEEIRTLIAEAETAGVIEPGERAMIGGVMRLGDRPVSAVMTPRGEVDMIDLSDNSGAIRRKIAESIHSGFPVHEGRPEELLGVVQAKDLLNAYLRGEQPDVRKFVRQAPVILDTADALDVIEPIKESPVYIALIHDEHGSFQGIVTSADILEAIVGSFTTDEGFPDPSTVCREDGSWLISGSTPVDEMAERLSMPIIQKHNFHTVAGFVLDRLGHLPRIGESFEEHGWQFEVIDMEGRRVDKILAKRIARAPRRAAL